MQCTQKPAGTADVHPASGALAALKSAAPGVTPAATLRAVARYLTRYGWVQGSHYELSAQVFTPPACLIGAIAMVCYGGPVECPAHQYDDPGFDDFEAALAFLDGFLRYRYGNLYDAWGVGGTSYKFNDAKGRTADEVIAVLHKAADEWDQAFVERSGQLADVLCISGGAA